MIRNLLKLMLYPLLGNVRSKPKRMEPSDRAVPPNANANRLHVFAGTFRSELEATDYCLTPMGKNQPEPLTRDLADAMIDTAEVEIVFGEARILAALPMMTPRPDVGAANTLILIAEVAFGGLPYSLGDTPKLRYFGPVEAS